MDCYFDGFHCWVATPLIDGILAVARLVELGDGVVSVGGGVIDRGDQGIYPFRNDGLRTDDARLQRQMAVVILELLACLVSGRGPVKCTEMAGKGGQLMTHLMALPAVLPSDPYHSDKAAALWKCTPKSLSDQ